MSSSNEGEEVAADAQLFPLPNPPPPAGQPAEEGGPAMEDPRGFLVPDNTIWFEQVLRLGAVQLNFKGAARSGRIAPNDVVVLLIGAAMITVLATILVVGADMHWVGPVALIAIVLWVTGLLLKRRKGDRGSED